MVHVKKIKKKAGSDIESRLGYYLPKIKRATKSLVRCSIYQHP